MDLDILDSFEGTIELEKGKCYLCQKPVSPKNVEYHNKSTHKRCVSCNLPGCSQSFDFKYCYPCGLVKYNKTPYAKKQHQVFLFLQEEFRGIIMQFDRQIPGQNCSAKRPDVFIQLPHRRIFIEVDEKSHNSYSCEYSRMNEIACSGEIMPTIFIRFNVDYPGYTLDDKLRFLAGYIRVWMKEDKVQEHLVMVAYLFYKGSLERLEIVPMTPEEIAMLPKEK